jgi:hypothetical protein
MVVYHVICTCLGIEFELSRRVFFHFHEFDRVAHFHCYVNLRLRRYYFLIYKKIKIYNFCRLTIADGNYYDNFCRPDVKPMEVTASQHFFVGHVKPTEGS